VIYPHPPVALLKTPLFSAPGVGHVTAGAPIHTVSNLSHVVFRRESFYERALERLAADGRRRVAVLTTLTNLSLDQGHLPDLIAAWGAQYGLSTKPFWIIPLNAHLVPGVQATTRLLFDAPAKQCPDALIIDDDHMVPAATEALAAAGIDTETAVTVIGHCNFPDLPAAAVPIVRLGLDCGDLLNRMLDVIDSRTRGEPVTPVSWVGPLFDSELNCR